MVGMQFILVGSSGVWIKFRLCGYTHTHAALQLVWATGRERSPFGALVRPQAFAGIPIGCAGDGSCFAGGRECGLCDLPRV